MKTAVQVMDETTNRDERDVISEMKRELLLLASVLPPDKQKELLEYAVALAKEIAAV